VEEKETKTAREIDQVVCNWTIDNGVSLTENQLNSLVDVLCDLFEIDAKEELN